jgi:hypothetical protein
MEHYGEVGVPDFLRLMQNYLDGKIDVDSYCSSYFDLAVKRNTITSDESRIIYTAYHDADDYDPEVRLEHTILEPELRRRIAMSIEELAALGHKLD